MTNKILPHSIIGGSALILVFLLLPYGPGVSPDSTAYLQVADNILKNKGLINYSGNFVNHWPPLYPVALGLFCKITFLPVLKAGIFFNTILLVVSCYFFLSILRMLTIKPGIVYITLAMLPASLAFTVYSMYWSETLFIPLFLASLFYLLKWKKNPTAKYLVISGIWSGLFFLTRYAGAGCIGGMGLIVLWMSGSVKSKIKNGILFSIPTLLISIPWFVYSALIGGNSTDRVTKFHPVGLDKVVLSAKTVASWFTGASAAYKVWGIPLFLIAAGLLGYLLLKNGKETRKNLILHRRSMILMMLLIVTYYVLLLVSISFFDAMTPLDHRMLSPLFPLLLLLLAIILQVAFTSTNQQTVRKGICIIFVFLMPFASYPIWKEHYQNGNCYTGRAFTNSPTLEYAKKNIHKNIYSNGDDLILFYTRKQVLELPSDHNPFSETDNSRFKTDVSTLFKDVTQHQYEIIYFNNIDWRTYNMAKDSVLTLFKDQSVTYFKDGFVIRKK